MRERQLARGRHFLRSSVLAAELVRSAQVEPGDLVLDIGAGGGVLTSALVRAGADVIAIEIDSVLAARLRDRFDRVVEADALEVDLPREPFRVVANLPFAVGTSVLRRLLRPEAALRSADVIVDWRLAAKRTAGTRARLRPACGAPGSGRSTMGLCFSTRQSRLTSTGRERPRRPRRIARWSRRQPGCSCTRSTRSGSTSRARCYCPSPSGAAAAGVCSGRRCLRRSGCPLLGQHAPRRRSGPSPRSTSRSSPRTSGRCCRPTTSPSSPPLSAFVLVASCFGQVLTLRPKLDNRHAHSAGLGLLAAVWHLASAERRRTSDPDAKLPRDPIPFNPVQ